MDSLLFSSVEHLHGYDALAAFTVNSSAVFKEDLRQYQKQVCPALGKWSVGQIYVKGI